jgi:hypothetical protein
MILQTTPTLCQRQLHGINAMLRITIYTKRTTIPIWPTPQSAPDGEGVKSVDGSGF